MSRSVLRLVRPLPLTILGASLAVMRPIASQPATNAAEYEVLAIRYATLRNFPVSALVSGADTSRRMDIAMMVWLLRAPHGRNVLVDAGFHREPLLSRWQPSDYRTSAEAVLAAGVEPAAITDLVISHVHWDHLGGADLFPNARVWIQRAEYEHHVGPDGQRLDRAIDSADAVMLDRLMDAGRVMLVDGDAREILQGITAYTGGRHTFASQYVGVRTAVGTVVIASDNAYLYENLDRGVPITQTLDPASNLAAQRRMVQLASDPRLIVPGHDPAVLTRFEEVAPGVFRIR